MTTLAALRKALNAAATAGEAAKAAKELASDPANAALLLELVTMLADAVITRPRGGKGRPRKVTLGDVLPAETQSKLVNKRTKGNVALSEYAHIVNARNIADGRKPEYAGYGVEMSQDEAVSYLKERRLFSHGRSGIKARAKKYVLARSYAYGISEDAFEAMKRELRQHD